MSKVLFLDGDGLVIRPRYKYFSEKYSEDYGIPLERILPFFKGEYKKAAIGEVDIREVLPPYLKEWGWKGSIDEFLSYWFESEKDLDGQVIKLIDSLRKSGIKCYVVSDNEKNRGRYVMETLGLKDHFDGSFFSSDLGSTKSEPSFFQKIVKVLSISPEEIIYFDDDQKNVDSAKAVGLNAFFYDDYGEFVRKLDELFLMK